MDIIHAIILSIVEGVTEFLPISSTGHLILTANILNIPQTDFAKSFEIIIQLGSIMAVSVVYAKKLLENRGIWPKVLVAFLPTAIVGLTLYKIIKGFLLGNSTVTLLALFLGGILIIVLELLYKQKDHHASSLDQISYKQAFLIGLAQSVSVIPGVSRSAATIIGGMFSGLKRNIALEFSFILAIPTMFAATGLDLVKSSFKFSSQEYMILGLGLGVSFVTALVAIKFLLKYVQTHTFIPFGIYRVVLSILFWMFVVLR